MWRTQQLLPPLHLEEASLVGRFFRWLGPCRLKNAKFTRPFRRLLPKTSSGCCRIGCKLVCADDAIEVLAESRVDVVIPCVVVAVFGLLCRDQMRGGRCLVLVLGAP